MRKLLLVPAAAPKAEAVCINPWKWEDGEQAYCDASEGPDGWSVYTRYSPCTLGPDLSDEQDFPDRDSALIEANARADLHGVKVREY